MSASNANATQKWVSDKYTPLTDFDKLRKDLPNIFQVRGNYASSGSFDKFQKSIENEYMQRKEADGKYQPKGNYQPAGQYITKPELQAANFATKGDLASYQPVGDYQIKGNYQPAGDYALKSDLSAFQPKGNYQPVGDYQPKGNYQPAGDYALKSDLSVFQPKGNYQTAGDYQPKGNYQPAGDYALKSDLSGFQAKGEYALKGDLSGFQPKGEYTLKGDLTGFQPKGEYASKGDLTGFQPKGEYALKGDLTGFQPKGNYQPAGDYALKSDLAKYQPAGDYQPKGNYQPAGDYQPKGDYALKGDLTGFQPKGNYQPAGDYALKSDILKGITGTSVCEFDATKYAAMYPDLKKAYGNDAVKLKNHYENFGKAEGRSPCGDAFKNTPIVPANVATKGDLATYALKSDLAGFQPKGNYQPAGDYQPKGDYALKGDLTGFQPKGNYQPAGDYALKSDILKGITGTSVCEFDATKYAAMYPDLKKAYGNDAVKLKNHYENFGKAEGRSPCGDAFKNTPIVPANVATKGDLATYALKSDLAGFQAKGDYALKGDLTGFQPKGNYQPAGDYALKSDIPKGAVGPSSLGSDNIAIKYVTREGLDKGSTLMLFGPNAKSFDVNKPPQKEPVKNLPGIFASGDGKMMGISADNMMLGGSGSKVNIQGDNVDIGSDNVNIKGMTIKYASQGEPAPKGIKGSTVMLFGPNANSFNVNDPPKNPPKNLPLILSNGDGSMMAISADNIYMGSSDSNVNINGKQVNINGELIVSGAKLTPRDYALKSDIPKGVVGGDASEMIKKSSMWCADGAVCKIPAGSKGIDWGYGGSKIYDDSQLNIESDDNIYFRTGSKNKVIVNNDGAVVDGKLIVKGELDVNAINISGWKVEGGPENSLVFKRGNATGENNQPYLRMGQDGNLWVSRSSGRGWVPDQLEELRNKTKLMNYDGKMSGGAINNWAFGGKDLSDMYEFYNDRGNYVKKNQNVILRNNQKGERLKSADGWTAKMTDKDEGGWSTWQVQW